MQWNSGYTEQIYSFTNNINNTEGGTHLIGFKAALTKFVNNHMRKYAKLKDKDKEASMSGEDVREGLTAVMRLQVPAGMNPQFEGQTKTKLGNTEFHAASSNGWSKKHSRPISRTCESAKSRRHQGHAGNAGP